MATAIIFSPPGGGKTVNSTLIGGKTLLLSSDNSAVVLNNFKRENLTIKPVPTFKEFLDEFEIATTVKQYDTIITDCLSDLIDGYIVECRESKAFNDIRQAYMLAYTKVKALARKAAHCGTDCIFTCWEDVEEITGKAVYIEAEEMPELTLEEDGYAALVGWMVLTPSEDASDEDEDSLTVDEVGEITDFIDIPNNPCIEVETKNGAVMIPLHEDLILSVDPDSQEIIMQIPEGLI